MPGLREKLRKAGMAEDEQEFITKSFLSAFYLTTGVTFLIAVLLAKLKVLLSLLYILFPVLFIFMFFYLLKLPDVKIGRREKEISKEIVFVGRFLVIELGSGVSIYNALINVSKNYPSTGSYFREIINKVDVGTPLEDAITEAIEYSPSPNMRRVLWQIINSLKTGSNVTDSLKTVVEQITREQIIEVKKYGKKLNPLAMFYMMIAVIIPTLGVTMLIVLSSFLSLQIDLILLMALAIFLGFLQFMFLAVIKSSRPAVEL